MQKCFQGQAQRFDGRPRMGNIIYAKVLPQLSRIQPLQLARQGSLAAVMHFKWMQQRNFRQGPQRIDASVGKQPANRFGGQTVVVLVKVQRGDIAGVEQ